MLHAKIARLTGNTRSKGIQSGMLSGNLFCKQTRQLATTDMDILWGFDAKPNTVALNPGHRNDDAVADMNFF